MRATLERQAVDRSELVFEWVQKYLPSALSTTDLETRTVGVMIAGERWHITDIQLRMFQPAELFKAQGFRDDYIINPRYKGKVISKSAQGRLVGNSVPPPVVTALVNANYVPFYVPQLQLAAD